MAITSYPWATHPLVSTAQWSDMAKRFRNTGVIPYVDNALEVYADSTGMQVKVKTGKALIEGVYAINDAESVLSISASNPSNPRIDVIVVRVDWVNEAVSFAIVSGTPGATPVEPSLTISSTIYEMKLASVYVDAAAVTVAAGKVTDGRTMSYAQASSPAGLAIALGG